MLSAAGEQQLTLLLLPPQIYGLLGGPVGWVTYLCGLDLARRPEVEQVCVGGRSQEENANLSQDSWKQ